jgi:hypothetical protein
MADAAEPGREGAHGHGRASRERGSALEPERCGDARSEARATESSVGSDAHGLPYDVAGHTFPAGRGQEQKAWEPPRAIAKEVTCADRPAKLRALGNAVVPQCALVVGRVLVAILNGRAV